MNFKINTKEKFTTITPLFEQFADNITEELVKTAQSCLKTAPRNLILDLQNIKELQLENAAKILALQQEFYEQNASFVICNLNKEIAGQLEEEDILEMMNVTPTESEAWDIVQMEEIERELLDDDSPEFNQLPD